MSCSGGIRGKKCRYGDGFVRPGSIQQCLCSPACILCRTEGCSSESTLGSNNGGHGVHTGGTWAVPCHGPQLGRDVPHCPWSAECHPASFHHQLQCPCGREKVCGACPGGRNGRKRRYLAVLNRRNGLLRLRRELNLPETLVQAGVDPRNLWRCVNEIVEATLADPCCTTNPMPVEGFLVRRILEEVTGRV